MNRSMGYSPMTLAAAFAAARKFAGDFVPVPRSSSDLQVRFVPTMGSYRRALPYYGEYLDSIAADTAAEVNAFLAEHGFDIQLQHWPNDGHNFGVAGVSDILDHWVNAADLVTITGADGQSYKGFSLADEQLCEIFEPPPVAFRNPVAQVRTKDGLNVRFVMCDPPDDQLHMARLARILHIHEPGRGRTGHSAAHLPMVDLNIEPDVSWLIGLVLSSPFGDWLVKQAKMQVMLKMNEKGFRAKEAAAMGMREMVMAAPAGPLVFNRPFLMTAGKPDVPVPVFSAYIAQDTWTNPGNL